MVIANIVISKREGRDDGFIPAEIYEGKIEVKNIDDLKRDAAILRRAPEYHIDKKQFPIYFLNIETINGKPINKEDIDIGVISGNKIVGVYRKFYRKFLNLGHDYGLRH